jgi:Arc/MetJ-type ribon-helix-helix transcriptional regulator
LVVLLVAGYALGKEVSPVTTPQRGFKEVVVRLIGESPGLAAEEYAVTALQRGLAGSNSKDPVQSLATTLAKEVREGRMLGIRAQREHGKLRYFPVDLRPDTSAHANNGLRIEVSLRPDAARRVRDLVEIGRFSTPSEAVTYLLEEGVNAKQSALDRISGELEEIRRRKESARGLL